MYHVFMSPIIRFYQYADTDKYFSIKICILHIYVILKENSFNIW